VAVRLPSTPSPHFGASTVSLADGLIGETANPAIRVAKPRRLASTRRALPDRQLAQIVQIAATTGNDPALDCLLLRLHIETACRRGGALALRRCDLDVAQCLVRLWEKGETVRWQPVSPTLMRHLLAHADERRAQDPNDQVLRYHNGNPLTTRRYDHLWQRLSKRLPWVAAQQISTHWLRHTTLTWVERNFSYAVARAYAGHTGKSDAGTTTTYVRAQVEEVAAALATPRAATTQPPCGCRLPGDPEHRFWRGRPIPVPPAGTDLAHIPKQMLTRPWDLPHDVCHWLINKVGEQYITN